MKPFELNVNWSSPSMNWTRCSSLLTLAAFTAVILLTGSAWAGNPTESAIYSFTPASGNPIDGLVAGSAGNLYGTTFDGTGSPDGTVFELSPNSTGGWTEATLVTFNGSNGNGPLSIMVVDSSGNLYGTTTLGGAGKCAIGGTVVGCGVVFELSPTTNGGPWTYALLYSFKGGNDGSSPAGNLVMDRGGNLYGTTGFAANGAASNGTVWQLKPPAQQGGAWTEKLLHVFQGSDGALPHSLVLSNGALYGTADEGGQTSFSGVVFELKQVNGVWTETVLYNFTGGSDGGFPFSVVPSVTPGDFYGTASAGGQYGYGVIFKLTPNSGGTWTESVLYSFIGGADGGTPLSPLLRDRSDNLYGTASTGGLTTECSSFYPFDGCGVIFKFSTSTSTETVLHAFSDTGSDGNLPSTSGVVLGTGGVLYGTTEYGGTGGCTNFNGTVVNCGTVYKITP